MQGTAIGKGTRRAYLCSRSARGQIGNVENGGAKPEIKMRGARERKFARGNASGACYRDRRADFGILCRVLPANFRCAGQIACEPQALDVPESRAESGEQLRNRDVYCLYYGSSTL